eukprot:SAG31_NODE_5491_length_2504_cov_1.442412_6_plen_23_part_01
MPLYGISWARERQGAMAERRGGG